MLKSGLVLVAEEPKVRRMRVVISRMKPEVLGLQRARHLADANGAVAATLLAVVAPLMLTPIPCRLRLMTPCEQKGDHTVGSHVKVPEGTLVTQGSCIPPCFVVTLLKQLLVVQAVGGRKLEIQEVLSGRLSIVRPEGPLHCGSVALDGSLDHIHEAALSHVGKMLGRKVAEATEVAVPLDDVDLVLDSRVDKLLELFPCNLRASAGCVVVNVKDHNTEVIVTGLVNGAIVPIGSGEVAHMFAEANLPDHKPHDTGLSAG